MGVAERAQVVQQKGQRRSAEAPIADTQEGKGVKREGREGQEGAALAVQLCRTSKHSCAMRVWRWGAGGGRGACLGRACCREE